MNNQKKSIVPILKLLVYSWLLILNAPALTTLFVSVFSGFTRNGLPIYLFDILVIFADLLIIKDIKSPFPRPYLRKLGYVYLLVILPIFTVFLISQHINADLEQYLTLFVIDLVGLSTYLAFFALMIRRIKKVELDLHNEYITRLDCQRGHPMILVYQNIPADEWKRIQQTINQHDEVHFWAAYDTRKRQPIIRMECKGIPFGILDPYMTRVMLERMEKYHVEEFYGEIDSIEKTSDAPVYLRIKFMPPTDYSPVTERIPEQPYVDKEGRIHCKIEVYEDEFSRNQFRQLDLDERLYLWSQSSRPGLIGSINVSKYNGEYPFAVISAATTDYINRQLTTLWNVNEMQATVSIKQRGTPLEIEIAFKPPQTTTTGWVKEAKEEI